MFTSEDEQLAREVLKLEQVANLAQRIKGRGSLRELLDVVKKKDAEVEHKARVRNLATKSKFKWDKMSEAFAPGSSRPNLQEASAELEDALFNQDDDRTGEALISVALALNIIKRQPGAIAPTT